MDIALSALYPLCHHVSVVELAVAGGVQRIERHDDAMHLRVANALVGLSEPVVASMLTMVGMLGSGEGSGLASAWLGVADAADASLPAVSMQSLVTAAAERQVELCAREVVLVEGNRFHTMRLGASTLEVFGRRFRAEVELGRAPDRTMLDTLAEWDHFGVATEALMAELGSSR